MEIKITEKELAMLKSVLEYAKYVDAGKKKIGYDPIVNYLADCEKEVINKILSLSFQEE